MIVEGLVTTKNADGTTNVAPMGPQVDPSWTQLTLRPFATATTCQNLQRTGFGVFHVTDDCELLARAAIDRLAGDPACTPVDDFPVPRLVDTCRWYALRVIECDPTEPRMRFTCRVERQGTVRDFLGFNRAKHAVLEAAILATRVHLLPAEYLQQEFARLRTIVDKTAGEQEQRAFAVLAEFVGEHSP